MYIPSSGTLSYSSGNLATITVSAMYDTNINTSLLHAATVDGYSVAAGDIVLLNGQTNKIQNGIYRILPGSGLVTPVRAILTDGVNTSGVTVYVKNGTKYTGLTFNSTYGFVSSDELTFNPVSSDYRQQVLVAAGAVTDWGYSVKVNSASAITVTLPPAYQYSIGKTCIVKNIGAGIVTIVAATTGLLGADTYFGRASIAQNESIVIEATAVQIQHEVSGISASAAAPVPPTNTQRVITQNSHGFLIGKWVRFDGTQWVLTDNTVLNGDGVEAPLLIITVTANTFTGVSEGYVSGLPGTLGLVAGQTYWLDGGASAGLLTATKASPNSTPKYLKSVFRTDSITSGYVIQQPTFTESLSNSYSSLKISTTTIVLPLSTPTYLFADATAGNMLITLPTLITPNSTTGTNMNIVYVKRLDATTNVLTVVAAAGQLIDDNASFNIDSQFTAFSFVPNTTDLTWGVF